MKKKWIMTNILFYFFVSTNLFATANAPIQRIDVVNMLWNSAGGGSGGLTPTPVTIAFQNGGARPCFTTTLRFLGTATVWVGIGQPCVTAVTSAVITPSGTNPVYSAPEAPTVINGTLYSTQITISQALAPTFDPDSGLLLTEGTAMATTVSHLG